MATYLLSDNKYDVICGLSIFRISNSIEISRFVREIHSTVYGTNICKMSFMCKIRYLLLSIYILSYLLWFVRTCILQFDIIASISYEKLLCDCERIYIFSFSS